MLTLNFRELYPSGGSIKTVMFYIDIKLEEICLAPSTLRFVGYFIYCLAYRWRDYMIYKPNN